MSPITLLGILCMALLLLGAMGTLPSTRKSSYKPYIISGAVVLAIVLVDHVIRAHNRAHNLPPQAIVSIFKPPQESLDLSATHQSRNIPHEVKKETFQQHGTIRERILLNQPGIPVALEHAFIEKKAELVTIHVHMEATLPIAKLQVGTIMRSLQGEDAQRLLIKSLEPTPTGASSLRGSIAMETESTIAWILYVHSVEFKDRTRWDHDPRDLQATLAALEGP